jgi:hypothetical protein
MLDYNLLKRQFADNWIDIAGYATLVANRLEKMENAA